MGLYSDDNTEKFILNKLFNVLIGMGKTLLKNGETSTKLDQSQ